MLFELYFSVLKFVWGKYIGFNIEIRYATVTVHRHQSHRHRSHRLPPATVTDPTGCHRPPSPIPPVATGHRHRSHRLPPATVTGPTGCHRPPSLVPLVATGHRHRSHRLPSATATGRHWPPLSVSPVATGYRHRSHRSHRSSPATVTGYLYRFLSKDMGFQLFIVTLILV